MAKPIPQPDAPRHEAPRLEGLGFSGPGLSRQQWDFCRDLKSSAVLASSGYGGGKTYALCRKALIMAAVNPPGCWHGLVGPTWRQVGRDIVPTMLQLGDEIGWPLRLNKNDATITQSRLGWCFALGTGEEPDSLKGPTWAGAFINEPGIQSEKMFEAVISRVRDHRAKVLQTNLGGTPEGFNWLWERFVRRPAAGYRVIYWRTQDNPTVRPEYVQMLTRSFDARLAQEKIEGQFVNISEGIAYYAFDRLLHVKAGLVGDPALPYWVALDFNVDPFTAIVGQQVGDVTRVLDEVVIHGAKTAEMAAALAARIAPQDPRDTAVYADASGAARQTGGESDFNILRSAGFEDLRVPAANPRVRNRVNAVNARLRNAAGDVNIEISDRCETLIRDAECVTWNAKTGELDKRDLRLTHATDALGYYVAMEYPIGGRPEGGIAIG